MSQEQIQTRFGNATIKKVHKCKDFFRIETEKDDESGILNEYVLVIIEKKVSPEIWKWVQSDIIGKRILLIVFKNDMVDKNNIVDSIFPIRNYHHHIQYDNVNQLTTLTLIPIE